MATQNPSRPRFEHGNRVRFQLGNRRVTGEVVRDRGEVGMRGRRLYDVRVPHDPFESQEFLLSEDDLELDREPAPAPPAKAEILDYLSTGGLVSILLSNTGAGEQPCAWLYRGPDGQVAHTLVAARGQVGGARIPFWRITPDGRILLPGDGSAGEYLATFGLDEQEAEDVIRTVGTAS